MASSLKPFVCDHPYFSMLVFICIGFLLRGMRRINLKVIRAHLEELDSALEIKDMERAKYLVDKLKRGFGFG